MNSLSLIVLCYNDSQSLPGLVLEWLPVLHELFPVYEIILVNDGSLDKTGSVCDHLVEKHPQVKVVHHPKNRGVGAGMATGMAHSSFDWIAYTDGDAQYVAEDLKVLAPLLSQWDVISGHRVNRADPKIRTVVSGVYNYLVRHLFQVSFRDVNSGLKIYSRKVIDEIGQPISRGPFYDAEMMVKSVRKDFKVIETPISHRPRKYGQQQGASLKSIMRTFRSLLNPEVKHLLNPDFKGKIVLFLLRVFFR
ncbi:MAG: glycosyltransferase family 2 protein [Bacteroidetes bacterium]|nr:glycosyltransferase family 2 protein [Bacteroidota bacterium]